MIQDFKIKFEEGYYDDDYETITYYFMADKRLLDHYDIRQVYNNVVHAEISVEVPENHSEASEASVMIAQTIEVGEGEFSDTEWQDVNMPYSDIEELLTLGEENFGSINMKC